VTITRHKVLKLYRSGIHSARAIARKLGKKTREQQLLVQTILIDAKVPTRRRWAKEELEVVKKLYPEVSAKTIAKKLTRTVSGIYQQACKMNVRPLTVRGGFQKAMRSNPATEFKKSHQPWNKGMKGLPSVGRMKETQFKKGQDPKNTLYDGAITIHTDWNGHQDYLRYKWIRISKGKWRMLHVVIWEHFYGPVPPGHIVVFADGDQMNCRLDNLRCISRAQHAVETRNKDGYIAKCLAAVHGFGKGGYDRDLYVELLKHPELLDAKRKELELRRLVRKDEDGSA
jgi:hypothetical protein